MTQEEKETRSNPFGVTRRTILPSNGKPFNRIVWSPDGRKFASAHKDEVIQIWNIDTGEETYTLRGKLNLSIAWAPDGIQLVSGGKDFLYIWDINTGEHSTLSTPGKLNKSVTWSPDGRILASGSTNHVILWNPEVGELLYEFTEHSRSINCVTWSPDGRTLASGSDDCTIRLWNPATKQLLETFTEHTGNVNSIAWSPDGQKFASASSDNTICIWDFEERKLLNILKGHTQAIVCVDFSYDGQLLASKSLDGTVQLWRSETGEPIGKIDETAYGWEASLAFHPHEPCLATLGERDTIIRIWDLQIDTLLNNIYTTSTAHYKSAKVVLVGDSGAGKTSLSLVLTNQPYVPPESTHGRHVWSLDSYEATPANGIKEVREILLWDLAGQVHYRLIHQIYLDEVNLALIVFNAYQDSDPLLGVKYWERALRLTQDNRSKPQNLPHPLIKKFLVATHMDLEEKRGNSEYIQTLVNMLNIDAYFETSAKTKTGIDKLVDAIKAAINWGDLPPVTSPRLFQRIKDFIAELKNRGEDQLLTLDSMRQKFLNSQANMIDDEQLKAQFETCITDMEVQGLVKKFHFGPFVLLKPELLDYYASALIKHILYNETEDYGSIAEEKVLEGRFDIPHGQRLNDIGLEKILLVEMISYLQRHEIVLREYADDGSHLVFPSLVTHEPSNSVDIGRKAAIFRFEGPILNIYTRLLVKLSHSNFFIRKDVGKDIATFTYSYNDDSRQKSGACGIALQDIGEGIGEIILFFNKNANNEFRILFDQYIYAHLKSYSLPDSIKRISIFTCPNCDESITESMVQRRRERGYLIIICPVCETKILIDQKGPKTPSADYLKTADIDLAANDQRNQEIDNTNLYGTSRAKIIKEEFDVFLCYNPADESVVRKIRQELMFRGLAPWFDKEDLRPGFPRQRLEEQQIEKIKSAAVFIGKEGSGPWQEMQTQALLREFVNRECSVIPILLPGAPDKPELPPFLAGMTPVDFRTQLPSMYQPLENLPQKEPDELEALSLDLTISNDQNDNIATTQRDDEHLYQDQKPLDQLIWGITGKRVEVEEEVVLHRDNREEVKLVEEDASMTDDIKENRRKTDEKIAQGEYDVFLSYNSRDREEVINIGNSLKDNGIAPWLDQWDLQPGKSWLRAVMQQIPKSKAAAIFISDAGIGPWQEEEMEEFLNEYVARDCPVIPVLLPNAPEKVKLPPFLRNKTWVDFRTNNPDPLKRLIWGITSSHPQKVYRPGILIASLGDSPLVVSAMYDLLKEQEKLTLDRVTVLHPENDDVKQAYKYVGQVLTDVQIEPELLHFEDADSWTNACVFLQTLSKLLRNYQKQDDAVYLSLAGGRKSMAALMAWVAPYFSCVKRLYHITSSEEGSIGEEDFPLVQEIRRMTPAQRSQALQPDLDHLSVVKIPLDREQPMDEKLFPKLFSSLPEDFEEAEARITGQTIFQEEHILKVEVTSRVIEQFRTLRKADVKTARIVRNGLLKMSQIATLRENEARSDVIPYDVPDKIKGLDKIRNLRGIELHSFTGLPVPVRPLFYREPDQPNGHVVICSLEIEDEHGYKTLEELIPELEATARKTSSVDRLPPVAEPAESVLIVPLGESPMVATQLYTLLKEVEQRTIREVVLIYPQNAATIVNGAEMIKKALRVEDKNVRCTLVGIEGLVDIRNADDCRTYQEALEKEIERVKDKYHGVKIDLALSGGRKGMTAMTIFAAQKHHIPYVYHTLINEEISKKIEDETTYEELNDASLSRDERLKRLFLRAYTVEGPDPYANFVLFRVPVFTAEGW